ncbi:MAG: CAF17-like 4Fe-4S cluster assembly/insertion protein YgfZ [Planctomycetota bacterium]
MRHESPLHARHAVYRPGRPHRVPADAERPGAARGMQAAAPQIEYVPYEPAEAGEPAACELVATYGEPESEYAAIRRGAGIFDSPHRGTILITGAERRDFLDRMVTQELKDLEAGVVKPTFWLNRKGRLEADLLLVELPERMLVDVDVYRAAYTVGTLSDYVFTEDVVITDVTGEYHHLAVHGPQAGRIVAAAGGGACDPDALRARPVRIAGVEVVVARRDQAGEVGLELIMPYGQAEKVWDALLGAAEGTTRVRPVGWYALNIARIEAGTPLWGIDFGPQNLPHETGALRDRVSFTKGCYLGQEIVARTETQGKPRQALVGLRPRSDLLPVAGAPVYGRDEADGSGSGPQVGVVTSSTLSPMLGSVPIAFAMLKTSYAEPGTTVLVSAEGEHTEAVVAPLCFHPGAAP